MPQKYYLIFILFLISLSSYANDIEQCPSVTEIKSGNFHSWLPLYIDKEELACDADVALFAKNVEYLEIAKWDTDYLEASHCFYHGKHPINSKITFAHNAWRPISSHKWIWVIPNKLAQCVSQNPKDCQIIFD